MSEITITKNNFESEVLNAEGKVLVDFWASWCGPCKMIAPVIEELSEELEGQVKVGKVNVDEQPELAAAFEVMSIPSLFVLKDGKVVNNSIGAKPKAQILEMLK